MGLAQIDLALYNIIHARNRGRTRHWPSTSVCFFRIWLWSVTLRSFDQSKSLGPHFFVQYVWIKGGSEKRGIEHYYYRTNFCYQKQGASFQILTDVLNLFVDLGGEILVVHVVGFNLQVGGPVKQDYFARTQILLQVQTSGALAHQECKLQIVLNLCPTIQQARILN